MLSGKTVLLRHLKPPRSGLPIFRIQTMSFSRLVRFVPKSNPDRIFIGQPVDSEQDVGLAVRKGQRVEVRLFHGQSALDPGTLSDQVESIETLLSPLSQQEVGTIRCIGLNVCQLFQWDMRPLY